MPSKRRRLRDLLSASTFRLARWWVRVRPELPATTRRYRERSSLLVVLAQFFPAVLAYNDPLWPHRAVLYLDTPQGQLSYHIHPRDVPLFLAAAVPVVTNDHPGAVWDGADKDTHNQRLQRLAVTLPSERPAARSAHVSTPSRSSRPAPDVLAGLHAAPPAHLRPLAAPWPARPPLSALMSISRSRIATDIGTLPIPPGVRGLEELAQYADLSRYTTDVLTDIDRAAGFVHGGTLHDYLAAELDDWLQRRRPVFVTADQRGFADDTDSDFRFSNGLRLVVRHDACVLSTFDGRRFTIVDAIDPGQPQPVLDLELREA